MGTPPATEDPAVVAASVVLPPTIPNPPPPPPIEPAAVQAPAAQPRQHPSGIVPPDMLRNAEQFLYGDEDRPDDYAAEYEMYMEDDEEGGQDGLDMIIETATQRDDAYDETAAADYDAVLK